MNCIRVTVETADSSQSCLVPVVDDVENLLAEDQVISALQARVVDLFYLAIGYPARDLLILGDPWRKGNGRDVTESVPSTRDVVDFMLYDRARPAVADSALCVCGHPYARHNDKAGGGGCHLCRCSRFLEAPATWALPVAEDRDECACGHPRSAHSPVSGLCGGELCECRLWRPPWTTPGALAGSADDAPDRYADGQQPGAHDEPATDDELPF